MSHVRVLTVLFALSLVSTAILTRSDAVPVDIAPVLEHWNGRYDGPHSQDDLSYETALSSDGQRLYVVGVSSGTRTSYDYITVAMDAASGQQLWASRYDGTAHGWDYSRDIALSPDDSRVYVTGRSFSSDPPHFAYVTIAYDSLTGSQLWLSRFTGTNGGEARDIAVSPDGAHIYVTGSAGTVAYDADGNQLWTKQFPKSYAVALAISADGSKLFVIGGSSSSQGNSDFATFALDSLTGTELWLTTYDGGASESPSALALSEDGNNLYVVGRSGPDYVESDYATMAYNTATGTQLWSARYDGPSHVFDEPADVGVSADGSRVVVTGESWGDYATVSYEATTGVQTWVSRFHSPVGGGFEGATALAFSPDGHIVYVTGWSADLIGSFYATIAYDAMSGLDIWQAQHTTRGLLYPGTASGYSIGGLDLAISLEGDYLYVAGNSDRNKTYSDIDVVSYCTLDGPTSIACLASNK